MDQDDSDFGQKLSCLDEKCRVFFDKVACTVASDSMQTDEMPPPRHKQDNNTEVDESIDHFKFASFMESVKNSDVDVRNLRLVQKNSIIDLIKRNREHGILVNIFLIII